MNIKNPTAREIAAANRNKKEKEYWLNKLSGQLHKTTFPSYHKGKNDTPADEKGRWESLTFSWTGEFFEGLNRAGTGSHQKLHILLVSGLVALLARLSENDDIILGTPIYKPADKNKSEGEFINTLLALRNRLKPGGGTTFKELILQVVQTVKEAVQHQDYPIGILADQLDLTIEDDEFPLFDVMMVLENIQGRSFIPPAAPYMNIIFSFLETGTAVEMEIQYRPDKYERSFIEGIAGYLARLLTAGLANPDRPLSSIDILPEQEKHRLLVQFNDSERPYPLDSTIQQWVEAQVEKGPDRIAVTGTGTGPAAENRFTYRELNERANQLAHFLRKNGVGRETVVGIMMEPSIHMIAALLGILKAGGAYLPIDTGLPAQRVLFMLEDAGAKVLLATSKTAEGISFTALRHFGANDAVGVTATLPRPAIANFEQLPMPDRSAIDLRKYKNKIGMASVTGCISLQATRGCPYECLFCHKVWSKKHTFRSAEHIFNEVEYYYKKGVRNFAVIDDCFNLNRENSSRFFKLLIRNKIHLQLFFPNGLRGDLLTADDIDLMVEAGTRGINLSLETASPRLQKLIKKNLDIDKFKRVMDYIAGRHPHVVLEIATMHGFPTETEEEAMITLDFIKSIQWLHFPYIHILKIYPNTEMEALALEHGVSKEDILASRDLAFHELPRTLPFPKSFTRMYQSDFMNNYFLLKERLSRVIPVQRQVLGEAAMVEKYNTYMPAEIADLQDIIDAAGLSRAEIQWKDNAFEEIPAPSPGLPGVFDLRPEPVPAPPPSAKKILLLDLSQHFSGRGMLYNVVEQPLGLMALLTCLRRQMGAKITGRIYKAGIDFDSFGELKTLVDDFAPDLVGIRALTFYKEFFHETASLLRQWGVGVPIIAGGPYATSDYHTLLKDENIDLAVLGEGEHTMVELLEKMPDNNFTIPGPEVLKDIRGIAFARPAPANHANNSRRVIRLDEMAGTLQKEESRNPEPAAAGNSLAYVMYTSGSTGKPKGVMVEHRQVQNCIWWMQEKFHFDENHGIVQRTNIGFDPSVWEMFWPLYLGGKVMVPDMYQRKDAEYLIRLMENPGDMTMMYCPATLVSALTYVLNTREGETGIKPRLKLPWLITGAEPISMETVKNFYSYYEGKIVNTYGPTECTVNNTYYDLSPEDPRAVVPIGRPVANNKIYILSRDLLLLPLKIPGEICIAGAGVARGYIGKEKKTVESFIANPFGPGRLYKSGDMGRWLEDGTIEILGRKDRQVKIRGHRIETGEIEAALAGHSAVEECLVTAVDKKARQEDIRTCKRCGIGGNYPGVRIDEDGNCEICENISRYKRFFNSYFKTPADLERAVRQAGTGKGSAYDCLLLYSGGRGAGYALYRLVDMGFRVLAATYDNGYFSKKDLENIRRITTSVEVDHVVLRHEKSAAILKESIRSARTVCRGCFHTSGSLGAEYAYRHNIPVVVGATLSRGQIIENKLFMFAHQDIRDPEQLEQEIAAVQHSAPDIDKKIFDLIDIDIVMDRTVYEKVTTLDFYRYWDITNEEMIRYLDHRDPYWRTRKNYAVYSTNCSIKQVGDYGHLQGAGYHYYGSATSWEKRLGHIGPGNLAEDLQCNVTRSGYENFLKRLGTLPEELARGDEKYLAAYIVSKKELDAADLRTYLSGRLPSYMIPSYFQLVDEIPLDVNGKVDMKKLPEPSAMMQSEVEYRQPGSEVEEKLVEVWHEVLGLPPDRIGVDDNFFQLGGDSIKAIRISARLQHYRLKLDISRIFLNPTIRQLAGCVEGLRREIPQETVSGPVPLTPVQHWFFQQDFASRHHFNQSVMLYREEGFDENYVKKAFTKMVEHHDALRMVFSKEGEEILQLNRGIDEPLFHMEVVSINGGLGIEAETRTAARRIQQGLHLAGGPLVNIGLFKTGEGGGDHLLIVIHHLVVDGVSWRILLEDFETGYLQAQQGIEITFQAKTDSFKYWSEKLTAYAQTEEALKELPYWREVEEAACRVGDLPRRRTLAPQARTLAGMEIKGMELDSEDTEKLLKEAHRAYNTEINDLLLTALGLAVNDWAGREKVTLTLEGHGREPIIPDVVGSRTVGWYTSQFPVLLDMGKAENLPGHIKGVKETLRRIPHKGIGYGILRFLAPADRKGGFSFQLEPQIIFNYLGQVGEEGSGTTGEFEISPLPRGEDRSPDSFSPQAVNINGLVTNGKLVLYFAYHKEEFQGESIEQLAASCKSFLLEIIGHCVSMEETEMTVSDFDADDLDEEEMEAIYDELG